MRTEWDDAKLNDWIDRFKKAAVLFHNGQYLAARAMEQAGSDACNALIRDLEAGHNIGRDILPPLYQVSDSLTPAGIFKSVAL
jgi:hypothetical protein